MSCSKYVLRVASGLMWALFALFADASVAAQDSTQPPTVDAVRAALDQARFEDAAHLAQTLLSRPDTGARDRNDALELLAIVQIAQRNSAAASETLKLLFDRDAEHPQRVHDPGPAVDAAIARARLAQRAPVTLVMRASTRRDAYGRTLLDVELGAGADLVDALHVFVRAERDPAFSELVKHPRVNEPATIILPAAPLGATQHKWYLEARAPSGLVLARIAAAREPSVSVLLPQAASGVAPCAAAKAHEPLHRRWWVWTSVGVAIAGVAVAGAIATQ